MKRFLTLVMMLALSLPASAQFTKKIIFTVSNAGSVIYTRSSGLAGINCSTNTSCAYNSATGLVDITATLAGGASSWSSITDPAADLTLSAGAFKTQITWNAATGAPDMFVLVDTSGNTGTGHILRVSTAATSAAKPVGFFARGTVNGVEMSVTGVMAPTGTGGITANSYSGTVPAANLGSGTPSSANFLRGDSTWVAAATGTVTDFSAGDAAPLFTTTEATTTTTPALTFVLTAAAANKVFANCTSGSATPNYCSLTTAMLPFTYTTTNGATKLATSAGSVSSGKCLEWDANGNIVTAVVNAACGSGGGGGVGTINAGTVNQVPAYTGTGTTIGPSICSIDASNETCAGGFISTGAAGAGGTQELGSNTSTVASRYWVHSGDAPNNAEPGAYEGCTSPNDTQCNFIYPASVSGRWAMSGSNPGADPTDWIPAFSDLQKNAAVLATDSSVTPNTVTLTPATGPCIGLYVSGMHFWFIANTTNTGATTVNICGVGGVAVQRNNAAALSLNDFRSGHPYEIVYTPGGVFDVVSQLGNASSGGSGATTALDNLASVALNASLTPGTAGGIDVGSTTKPVGKMWFAGTSGTPGTNNANFTGVFTAPRTFTWPDRPLTVAGTSGSLTNGKCLEFNSSGDIVVAASNAACGVGGTVPTGTGFPHITIGAQDGAARAVDVSTADVTGIMGSANGGTGNGFAKISGPAASEKTYTLPNSSQTIETQNNKNAASGYAGLDANSRIATGQELLRTVWIPYSSTSASACSANAVANQVRWHGVYLPYTLSATNFIVRVITADTGANTYDIGVYNSAGTLAAHTGAITGASVLNAAATVVIAITGGPITLPPGKYYWSFISSSATGNAVLSSASSNVPTFLANAAAGTNGSGGVLPGTETIPGDTWTFSGATTAACAFAIN